MSGCFISMLVQAWKSVEASSHLGRLIIEISISHTNTRTLWDSPVGVVSPLQRPPPTRRNKHNRNSIPQRVSNPQCQQSGDRRLAP